MTDTEVILAEIMQERPAGHWTPHRLRMARMLASEMVKVEVAQQQLATVPLTSTNGRGNPVPHPLVKVMVGAMQNVCSLRRNLAIHARALGGDPADIARRRTIRLEQQQNAPTDRDLIAWPAKEDENGSQH